MCREMEIMRNQAHEEGVEQGSIIRLIKQVCAKMQKFSSAEEIANNLVERDVPLIQKIMDVAPDFAPDYNADAIYKALNLQSCRNSPCGETLQQKIFPKSFPERRLFLIQTPTFATHTTSKFRVFRDILKAAHRHTDDVTISMRH